MFGNLKAEMARHGLTNKNLAEILGVTEKTIRGKMCGKTGFTLKEMRLIQKAIPGKIPIDFLFEENESDYGKAS